jgi:hypothetical protein
MNTKLLTISIVVLFLGLAVAPTLQADTSKPVLDGELVEITTEVCGLPAKKPQTVQLTPKQVDEVDKLFEDIRTQLDNAESREEAVQIFKEAIVELDRYGLLGGLSIEQAQRLITERFQNPGIPSIMGKLNSTLYDENENIFCLTVGKVENTFFQGFFTKAMETIAILLHQLNSDFTKFLSGFIIWFIVMPLEVISLFIPVILGGEIDFFVDANGWVTTVGLLGVKSWNGSLEGGIHTIRSNFTAVAGFTGLKILTNIASSENFFLGFARHVKIDYFEP